MLGLFGLFSAGVYGAAMPRSDLFEFDAAWKPELPVGGHTYSGVGISASGHAFLTQRGNTSVSPILVLDTKTGKLVQQWGKADVAIAGDPLNGTWGCHGIAIESCAYECAPESKMSPSVRAWVEDFTGHTVTAFTSEGTPLVQIGQKGVAGNGTDPLQFGNVADAAIQTAATSAEPTIVYATDGDGGYDNRVVKIAVEFSATETPKYSVDWATPHSFNSPHSIALHARTNMLVVADRGNNATKLLDAATGKDLGVWDCGLDFGEKGVPFGVRTLSLNGHDLVLVASMDNPQDHRNQFIHVLDASKLSAATGSASACSVLQTITIDPAQYSGPHLLGVDPTNGDIYAVLVADVPLSTVLRFAFKG